MTKKIEAIKDKIIPVLKRHQVKRLSIFGSFARGEEKRNSDVDMLVEMGTEGGIFSLVSLRRDLEKSITRKVDLITFNSIHPYIKKNIKKDEIKIYG